MSAPSGVVCIFESISNNIGPVSCRCGENGTSRGGVMHLKGASASVVTIQGHDGCGCNCRKWPQRLIFPCLNITVLTSHLKVHSQKSQYQLYQQTPGQCSLPTIAPISSSKIKSPGRGKNRTFGIFRCHTADPRGVEYSCRL